MNWTLAVDVAVVLCCVVDDPWGSYFAHSSLVVTLFVVNTGESTGFPCQQ